VLRDNVTHSPAPEWFADISPSHLKRIDKQRLEGRAAKIRQRPADSGGEPVGDGDLASLQHSKELAKHSPSLDAAFV
jgi:hypothetical protein